MARNRSHCHRDVSEFWYQSLQILTLEECKMLLLPVLHKLGKLVKRSHSWLLSSWAQSETGSERGRSVCMHEQPFACRYVRTICLYMDAWSAALPIPWADVIEYTSLSWLWNVITSASVEKSPGTVTLWKKNKKKSLDSVKIRKSEKRTAKAHL